LQGGLGGLGFWALGIHAVLLWTVLMAVLSLFPVFGAALVWVPVAGYLLGSGMIWQGILLAAYGVLVISLIDNIARPWLVGQATRMPDYVVLISTIGGIATFGVQGFITGPVVAAMFMAVWTTWIALPRSSLAP
jgi:predicted PurR-regulated permease PerM